MGRLYIYLHEWLIFMVNVGKYTVRPMDPMGTDNEKIFPKFGGGPLVIPSSQPWFKKNTLWPKPQTPTLPETKSSHLKRDYFNRKYIHLPTINFQVLR